MIAVRVFVLILLQKSIEDVTHSLVLTLKKLFVQQLHCCFFRLFGFTFIFRAIKFIACSIFELGSFHKNDLDENKDLTVTTKKNIFHFKSFENTWKINYSPAANIIFLYKF